ncbi:hypothetical protein TKK_0008776 [Trichogramma kaykai]
MDYSSPMSLESRMTPCRDLRRLVIGDFNEALMQQLNWIKRRHREPRITHELHTKRRERDRLYKEARRSHCPILWSEFRLLRKQMKVDGRRARKDYFFWQLDGAGGQSAQWKTLSEMGLLTAKNTDGSPLNTFESQELMEHYSAIT